MSLSYWKAHLVHLFHGMLWWTTLPGQLQNSDAGRSAAPPGYGSGGHSSLKARGRNQAEATPHVGRAKYTSNPGIWRLLQVAAVSPGRIFRDSTGSIALRQVAGWHFT